MEGRGKLRLKRKRPADGGADSPQASEARPQKTGLRRQAPASHQDTVAALPTFLPKGKEGSPGARPPATAETFHAGEAALQWVPFPLYPKGGAQRGESRRPRNPGNGTEGSRGSEEGEARGSTPPPEPPRPPSTRVEDPSKEMQLEKCPLCQMRFAGNWSQLEVDSHLAQCLSESTDDAW